MAVADIAAPRRRATGIPVVLEQELRDLWLGGRGPVLCFAFSVLLSVIAYLVATNRGLNFLEQRETVNLTLQVAVAVGALLTLLTAADSLSGERERGTFEGLLLTPVSKFDLTAGKRAEWLGRRAAAARQPTDRRRALHRPRRRQRPRVDGRPLMAALSPGLRHCLLRRGARRGRALRSTPRRALRMRPARARLCAAAIVVLLGGAAPAAAAG